FGYDIEVNPQSNEVIVLGRGDGEVFFDGVPMPTNGITDQASIMASYNLNGALNWVKQVLDEENYGVSYCKSLAINSSGIMGVCGYTAYSHPDGLVGFYNSDGSVISEHTYPATDQLKGYSIVFNEFDEAYLSGWCYLGGVLGMSPGTVTLSNTTGFIIKVDFLQQVKWLMEFESSPFDNRLYYSNRKLSYASRIDGNFIYNSGQNIIYNVEGDALFGEVIDYSLNIEEHFDDDITV